VFNIAEKLPAPLRPWYLAARPRSLPATYAPLFIAGAVALFDGVFEPVRYLIALIGALLLQIASNFINEYVDFRRGTDSRKVAGMGMVLSQGGLSEQQVLIGAIVTVLGGAGLGFLLVAMDRPALLIIGAIGVLVVITYTAGPLPLAYLGLGEIAVFFCMGPLMTLGAYYAVSGFLPTHAFLAGVPIAFTVAAILHANNMRDMEADKATNKRTLAVRFGWQGARREMQILIYGAYVAVAVMIMLGQAPIQTFIAAITLREAYELVKLANSTEDPKVLHRAQGMTAQLHWHLGVWLTIGWLIAALLVRVLVSLS
jgi:1,4-dihydroxy-2-naphthoate polyprenyltransferase